MTGTGAILTGISSATGVPPTIAVVGANPTSASPRSSTSGLRAIGVAAGMSTLAVVTLSPTSIGGRMDKLPTNAVSGVASAGQKTDAILGDVVISANRLRNPSVARQVREVVARLRAELSEYDIAGLPVFILNAFDDGSASIDWQFEGRRMAITLENNPEDSGWNFVSSAASGGVLDYGSFKELNLGQLLNRTRA